MKITNSKRALKVIFNFKSGVNLIGELVESRRRNAFESVQELIWKMKEFIISMYLP